MYFSDGWMASPPYDSSQYIKVDLKSAKRVTSIAIQGTGNGYYTKSFKLHYSLDNIVWDTFRLDSTKEVDGAILQGNGDQASVAIIELNPVIEVSYFR